MKIVVINKYVKQFMQKIFFILLFTLLLIPNFVLAAPDIGLGMAGNIAGNAGYDKNVTDTTLSETIGRYIKVALSLSGTIFLVLTVYAGFLWMTASGNEEQVTKATGILKMAVIGLVITLGSFSITVFVLDKVGTSTLSAPTAVAGGDSSSAGCGWWCGFKKQAAKPW